MGQARTDGLVERGAAKWAGLAKATPCRPSGQQRGDCPEDAARTTSSADYFLVAWRLGRVLKTMSHHGALTPNPRW